MQFCSKHDSSAAGLYAALAAHAVGAAATPLLQMQSRERVRTPASQEAEHAVQGFGRQLHGRDAGVCVGEDGESASSDPSQQSLAPSFTQVFLIQFPLSHRKWTELSKEAKEPQEEQEASQASPQQEDCWRRRLPFVS